MTAVQDTVVEPPVPTESLLEANGITMRFGGLLAVNDVTMAVAHGEILGLIGPNGAGKTTLFNCLTGLYKPTSGSVRLEGRPLQPKPGAVVRAGMARTFQNIRLFANMTALENVMVGRYCRTSAMALTSVLRGPKYRREEAATRERAQELLDFVGLGRSTESLARNMPYGDQRRLEIARALATDPKLLLLDEPTAGMGLEDVERTVDLVRRIRTGRTVVLVEHNMSVVAGLADRVTVLQFGRVLVEGTYDEVRGDALVIEAYLGGESAA